MNLEISIFINKIKRRKNLNRNMNNVEYRKHTENYRPDELDPRRMRTGRRSAHFESRRDVDRQGVGLHQSVHHRKTHPTRMIGYWEEHSRSFADAGLYRERFHPHRCYEPRRRLSTQSLLHEKKHLERRLHAIRRELHHRFSQKHGTRRMYFQSR